MRLTLVWVICLATVACTGTPRGPEPIRSVTPEASSAEACDATDVVLAELLAVSPAERVTCLGDETVTLRGYRIQVFGAGGCSGDEVPGAGWLRPCIQEGFLLSPDPAFMDGLLVLLHPDSGLSLDDIPAGALVEVIGHFDDPDAAECALRVAGAVRSEPAFVQACREVFVATELAD